MRHRSSRMANHFSAACQQGRALALRVRKARPFGHTAKRGMAIGAVLLLCCITGCVKTPYRYQVHDNGEGSVTVERVPMPSSPATAPDAQAPTDQQRIDALEVRVKALSAENEKLKQAATTTAPAKD